MQIHVDGHELGHGCEGNDVSLKIFQKVSVQINLLDVGKNSHVLWEDLELVLSEGELERL